MRIVSWNVNGLRSAQRKGFAKQIVPLDADVICLQEIKSSHQPGQPPVLAGYTEHWNSSSAKKGYSGTLTLTRNQTISVHNGLGVGAIDQEGRAITTEFDEFFVVNVYTPNSQAGLKRLDFRLQWETALRDHLTRLAESKPAILCGDLNVAHHEIDLANPVRNRGKSCFSEPERAQFEKLLDLGYLDAFRLFESGAEHYTFWRFNKGVREKNLGWRIDYFCVYESLYDRINDCYHCPEITGSDHCPIVLELL